jgi:hypothetical protein
MRPTSKQSHAVSCRLISPARYCGWPLGSRSRGFACSQAGSHIRQIAKAFLPRLQDAADMEVVLLIAVAMKCALPIGEQSDLRVAAFLSAGTAVEEICVTQQAFLTSGACDL